MNAAQARYRFPCPACGAGPGQPCRDAHGYGMYGRTHRARAHGNDPGSVPAAHVTAVSADPPKYWNAAPDGTGPRSADGAAVDLARGRSQGLIVAAEIVARHMELSGGAGWSPNEAHSLYLALLEAADRMDPDSL